MVKGVTLMSFVFFDAKAYLEDKNIYVRTEGKNISKGWIGIDCPYCQGTGQHFGINEVNKTCSCFQCGTKTHMFEVIKLLEQCNNRRVFEIIEEYSDYTGEIKYIERKKADEVLLPSGIEWKISGIAAKYLEERNFDPEKIQKQYNIGMTRKPSMLEKAKQVQYFTNRIIIPMMQENKLVTYTGRDYLYTKDPKYLNPLVEAVKVPTSSMVYNINNIKNKKAIILEGVTDVWRMGKGTISLQGITWTEYQIWLITRLKLSRAVILFDKGAERQARKLARRLSLHIDEVFYTNIKDGDPAELSEQEARKIKYDLIGSV